MYSVSRETQCILQPETRQDLNYSMNVCSFTWRCIIHLRALRSTNVYQCNGALDTVASFRIVYCLRRDDWKKSHRSVPWHSCEIVKTHDCTVYFKALVSGNLITIIDRRSVKRLGRHRQSHDASIFFTDTEEGDPSFRSNEMPSVILQVQWRRKRPWERIFAKIDRWF